MIGFHVKRPSLLAVVSPCFNAAYPWAYSCAMIENNRIGAMRSRDWANGAGRRVRNREGDSASAGLQYPEGSPPEKVCQSNVAP